MMVTRKVRCRKCGTETLLTYPDKLSEIGLQYHFTLQSVP